MVENLLWKNCGFNIDLNTKERLNGQTAFHLACENGHSKITKLIMHKPTGPKTEG